MCNADITLESHSLRAHETRRRKPGKVHVQVPQGSQGCCFDTQRSQATFARRSLVRNEPVYTLFQVSSFHPVFLVTSELRVSLSVVALAPFARCAQAELAQQVPSMRKAAIASEPSELTSNQGRITHLACPPSSHHLKVQSSLPRSRRLSYHPRLPLKLRNHS